MVGSSEKENLRFVDSIEGRIVKLQEELKKLVTTTISTDMFKGMVSGLTGVFSSLNSVIGAFDKLGMSTPFVLSSLTSMFMTIKALGTGTKVSPITNMFKGTSKTLSDVRGNISQTSRSFTTLTNSATKYSGVMRVAQKDSGKLSQNLKTSGVVATKVGNDYKLAANGTKGFSSSMVVAGAKSALTTVGTTLLNGALLTLVATGISFAIQGINNYVHANEIAHDKIADSIEITKSKISSLKTEKNELKSLSKEYDELTKKTKLTNAESEKLSELKQQIAEIAPELLVGYDANNDPILALNGSLKDYVESLKEAIKRQNELLKTQQNSAADKSLGTGQKYLNSTLNDSFNKYKGTSHAYDDFTNFFNNDGLKSFRDGANEYVKVLERRNDQISSLNIKNSENYQKYSEIELEQQQKVINKLSEGTLFNNFNKLNEKTKSTMSTLIGNFDWESTVANTLQGQNKFIKGFDTLSEKIGKNSEKVQEWNNKLISANDAYQKTGDIESYKNSISSVTSELEKLTGISKQDWEIGFTQQLMGGLDDTQIRLNEFLKGYHKTIQDLSNEDAIAIRLKAEFESSQNLLSDLTAEGQTFESAVNLLVKVNEGKVDYGNLPYQMQTFIKGALDGGNKMSTDELQAFMKVSTIISSQGELDSDTFSLITKMLNGELTSEEIELGIKLPDGTLLNKNLVETINKTNKEKGNKNIKVGVESDLGKFKKDLKTILGKDKDTKLKIQTEVEKKDLDGLAKTLKGMDEEKQIDILTSIVENGQLTIPELEQVLDLLPPEVQTIIRTILEESGIVDANVKLQNLPEYVSIVINTELNEKGKVELDKMAEWLNDTDLSKRVQLDIISNLANNDLDGLLKEIEGLDPEIQLQILSNAQTVLSTFGDLDSYKFTEKLIQLSIESGDVDSALRMFEKLDDEKKIKVITELVESGSLTKDELSKFLLLLPKEKRTEIKLLFKQQEELNTIKTKLDELPISKEINIQINKALAEGNIDGVLSAINGLPPEVQVQVLALISGAMSDLNEVDRKKIETKIAQLNAKDNVTPTVNKINNQQLKDKWVTITTIYKEIVQKYKGTVLGVGGSRPQSKSGFSNVSDTPQQASVTPMSTGFSNVSATPTSSPVNSPSVPSSNKVSAKSIGNFGNVATDAAKATKISTSYKNVLNMIKYGINLFQELENRISRTTNQLDLLALKMENAVGTEKISYLKTQNKLYGDQAKLQKTLFDSLSKQRLAIRSSLTKQGFTFDDRANLTSYEEQLLKLEQAYESAKKKEDAYSGKSESTKKKLSKATETANTKLDDAKKLTEEYIDLMYNQLPNAEQKWRDLQNSIKENNDEIERLTFENKIYKQKNALEELNNSLKQYENYTERASLRASQYSGANKIKYMKQESGYLQKQIDLTKEWIVQEKLERAEYKKKLNDYGAKFDGATSQITNYDDILNKYQNSEDLDKIKQYMDEYVDLLNTERESTNSIENLTNSMQDLNNEIKQLELESKLSPFSTAIDESNSKIKKLQDNLSIIDIKMNSAYGTEKLNLLRQQIALYEELEEAQKQSLNNMKQEESILQNELRNNGFNFNSNGDITNMKATLDKVKDSGSYEYINSVLEQWKELHEDEMPDAIKSVEDFKNSIKDAYKEQLSITQEIEDKIKSIYEKQLEDRKDAIQKETDAIKKSLEEQKKAYQDMRKEVDYQNDYTEKTDNISALEKKLEIAKKDNSLSNKKKIADLEKELYDARKELDEFVQNKVDEDIENGFDNAINSADESNDKKLEELEEYWSDSKIAEMISQSLQTGLFEGIDGTFINLQDAMLDFANTSGETFGVMGNVVKEELIANLGIALDTLKNYSEIMNGLGLDKVNPSISAGTVNSKTVNTGDISINISSVAGMNEQDLANQVKVAIEEVLQGAVQGL